MPCRLIYSNKKIIKRYFNLTRSSQQLCYRFISRFLIFQIVTVYLVQNDFSCQLNRNIFQFFIIMRTPFDNNLSPVCLGIDFQKNGYLALLNKRNLHNTKVNQKLFPNKNERNKHHCETNIGPSLQTELKNKQSFS